MFELRVRCLQVVEQLGATPIAPDPILLDSAPIAIIPTPCRVKDSRLYVEHNHFINGMNVTSSVVQGLPILTTLYNNVSEKGGGTKRDNKRGIRRRRDETSSWMRKGKVDILWSSTNGGPLINTVLLF
jgi:hypothetical protein